MGKYNFMTKEKELLANSIIENTIKMIKGFLRDDNPTKLAFEKKATNYIEKVKDNNKTTFGSDYLEFCLMIDKAFEEFCNGLVWNPVLKSKGFKGFSLD